MVAINNDLADIPSVNFSLQGSDVSAPGAARAQLYFKSNGLWYILNGGTATQLPANPMSAQGDIIYGGASGAMTRLAKGTKYQVLQMNVGATAPEWASGVAAIYATNAGQTISTSTDTTINFEDLVYDPLSCVAVGAGWAFTCPATGIYLVVAHAQLTSGSGWSATERIDLSVWKNGAAYCDLAQGQLQTDATVYRPLGGSALVECAAGDTLHINIWQNNGASQTLSTYPSANRCSIALLR